MSNCHHLNHRTRLDRTQKHYNDHRLSECLSSSQANTVRWSHPNVTQAAEKMLLVRAEEDQIPQTSPPCARALEPVDAQEEANLKQASPCHQTVHQQSCHLPISRSEQSFRRTCLKQQSHPDVAYYGSKADSSSSLVNIHRMAC